MQYNILGQTGIKVSELCFGVLPMGPLQANMPVKEGSELLLAAMQSGISFFDTAQMYQTYAHLRRAMDNYHQDIVITSKSTAADYATMEKAIIEGLHEVRRDYFDIFLLHAPRLTGNAVQERAGAWQCLLDYKRKGHIRAVGVSTHSVQAVHALSAEPEVEIIFSLINISGKGILGGNAADMAAAAAVAKSAGKGQYTMKVLGGGTLLGQYLEAIDYVRAIDAFQAHSIGMLSMKELQLNLKLFNGERPEAAELADLKAGKSWLVMDVLCKGCGICVEHCPAHALRIEDGFCRLQGDACMLCGYCAAACPEFAIRVK